MKTKIDRDKFRETWKETGSIYHSALAAGYSETNARAGRQGLSKACLAIVDGTENQLLSEEQLQELADSLNSPEEMENFIRLETVRAVKNGGKKELAALVKVLGTLKATHSFADTPKAVGIFNILAPTSTNLTSLENWAERD